MTPNDLLLKAIKERQEKNAEFGYGIRTADSYVKTLQDCVGSRVCYRYASTKSSSFNDVIEKAAKTLTYSNPDMVVEEKATDVYAKGRLPDGIVLPKNTLMVFRHVLTTPKKDRDGDILRTEGAKLDPKMLLLWQHVHTLPIGKYLGTDLHNSKKLTVYSAIVDVNELAHDAAVMVDNDMGRFSHGFRALEFTKLKEESGKTTSGKGFDVLEFEVMEESLVSVPSNVTAEVEEVILSLTDSKKLKSPIMRKMGAGIREKRTTMSVPVKIDLQLMLNGKNINGQQGIEAGGEKGCTCSGASEETDGKAAGKEGADDKEMTCKCGGKIVDGVCEKCGAKSKDTVGEEKAKKGGMCPDCGAKLTDDGICEECGYGMEEEEEKGLIDQDDADANNDMGTVMCPKCGTIALVNGKCPRCGTSAPAGKAYSGDKAYVSGSSLTGSWESIQSTLYEKATAFARKNGLYLESDPTTGRVAYVYGLATYDGNAILCANHADGQVSYHRAEWKMVNGEPAFVGSLKEVKIEISTHILEKATKAALAAHIARKSGRVLSSKNRKALEEVRDGLQEIDDKEMLLTRGGRALCRQSKQKVDEVIKSAELPQETSTEEITVKQAMAVILEKGTPEDFERLQLSMKALSDVDVRQTQTKKIRALVRR